MKTFSNQADPTECLVSEKYDGIQGIWDGQNLLTRDGNKINAPRWWLAGLPKRAIVGELWAGRGRFEAVQSIVCRHTPDDRWASILFMVFKGGKGALGPYARSVEHHRPESNECFFDFYNDVIAGGGEGVVLTDADGEQYKLKPIQDDDGELIDIVPGKGKNTGMAGTLVLRNRKGQIVRISTGMTIALRKSPPKIGAIIKYAFNGFTSKGMPRSARYGGLRAETSLEF